LKPIPFDTSSDALIIHTGALGDVICSLTAIECLFFQKKLDFCCQGHIMPLLKIVPVIRNVFDINSPMITSIFLSACHSDVKDWLRNYPYILLISFSADWENSLKKFNYNIVRIPPRPPVSEIVHTSQFVMDAIKTNPLIKRNNPGIQDFVLQKKTRSYTKSSDMMWKSVCIHPGSGSPFKNWSIENFISLSQRLHQQGHAVLWLLGPAEDTLIKKRLENNVNRNNIVLTNNIQTIMRHLRQSGIYVGNDSGISHLAAYMGIDTTVIFGPTDIRRWRPIGACVKTIPESFPVCSPCFENGIRQCSHKKCLSEISVSQVTNKLKNKLANLL
jgi:ADP-heptose:LPS heptosyltransferase